MEHSENHKVRVTVFTPTYNRRHTIERLYNSLRKQTFKDFEWLVIDDGSTDNTEFMIMRWSRENDLFPIRYYWKPNGGKHTAHNYALEKAQGEYFAIIDSDDWYAPDALEILINEWNAIPSEAKDRFSNVEGLCCDKEGNLVGTPWPKDVYDVSGLAVRRIQRDTRGMYRLSVLKEFPFPQGFEGGFVTEGLVWNRMARKYLTRFINKIVGYIEYQPNGLSKRNLRTALSGSKAAVLYYRELSYSEYETLLERIKCKANVYRYAIHAKVPLLAEMKKEKNYFCGIFYALIGIMFYIIDRIRLTHEGN